MCGSTNGGTLSDDELLAMDDGGYLSPNERRLIDALKAGRRELRELQSLLTPTWQAIGKLIGRIEACETDRVSRG